MSQKIGAFFIYLGLKKITFWVQLYGKWACWRHYNLYFEAFKGLLFRNAPIFLPHFCRKCHTTIPEYNEVDPLGDLNLKV